VNSIDQKFNLARQHQQAGRRQEAEALCAEILRDRPKHSEALNLMGVLQCQAGKTAEAVELINRAISIDSRQASYFSNLGVVLSGLDRPAEAIQAYRKALKLRADFPEVCNNLGAALNSIGKVDEAIVQLKKAIRLRPNYPDALNNLGIALRNKREPDAAINSFRQAISLSPQFAKAHHNLSMALREKGLLAESLAAARQATVLDPKCAEAFNSQGTTLQAMGRLDEAIVAYTQTIRLRPDFFEAYHYLGFALTETARKEEAAAALRRALELRPESAETLNNLAGVLHDLGQRDEALACYDRAIALQSDIAAMHSNRLFILNFNPRFDGAAILAEHRRWDQSQAQPLGRDIPPHANKRDPERKLRIGYFSPDFRVHCQSLFTIPLLSNHDHSKFEIYCYSDVVRPDEITHGLQKYADHWENIVGLNDAQIADRVRRDEVDIFVDLAMHMSDGRPLVFARKPAPIQLAWLAYPGTTGLSAMDYRLTDPYLDPPNLNDAHYSEESVRLPNTFWCYDPLAEQLTVNSLPALSNGYITFGCLNNFCKVTDATLGLWSKVLASVPNSRLLLLCPPGEHRKRILEKLGIEPGRIEFVVFQPRAEYLRTYQRVDLGLDTFPYNGHTTSLDSLWMGVPVVSLMGRAAVSRAGFSQASNLGLANELVAENEEQFLTLAKTLGSDLHRLSELRSTLRSRMQQSPLMDGKRFARDMEAIFQQIWAKYCATAI
jgi:protein O-GlcNAc transferase